MVNCISNPQQKTEVPCFTRMFSLRPYQTVKDLQVASFSNKIIHSTRKWAGTQWVRNKTTVGYDILFRYFQRLQELITNQFLTFPSRLFMINKNTGYHGDTQTANFSVVRPCVLVGGTNVSRNMRPPPSQLRYGRSPTYRATWCRKSEDDNVQVFL